MILLNPSASNITFPVNEYYTVSIIAGSYIELEDSLAQTLMERYPFLEGFVDLPTASVGKEETVEVPEFIAAPMEQPKKVTKKTKK